jgi:hypothetical protein
MLDVDCGAAVKYSVILVGLGGKTTREMSDSCMFAILLDSS